MYCMSGETMPGEFKIEISQFISDMTRTIASQKAESGESLGNGKKLMRYYVYKNLCELIIEIEGDEYAFSHVFITLEWNLLA